MDEFTSGHIRKLTDEEIIEILEKHDLWTKNEVNGRQANFSYCDLTGRNFAFAGLSGVDFSYAILHRTNFSDASLYEANFTEARLCFSNMSNTDCSGAKFNRADLTGANCTKSRFSFAHLQSANLTRATLIGTSFIGANLTHATLTEAVYESTNFHEANLSGVKIDEPICRLDLGQYAVTVRGESTRIGCKIRENDFWLAAKHTDEAIKRMSPNASEFWKEHGSLIKASIRHVMRQEKARRKKCAKELVEDAVTQAINKDVIWKEKQHKNS